MKRFFVLVCVFFTSCSSTLPELHLYVWGGFIGQELIEQFEAKYNCRVIVDTYDSNEAMYAKLKSGSTGYDLIFPTGYILHVMNHQEMLHPLEFAKIPNIKNVDWTALQLLNEKQHENAIPYSLTFSAIAYRQDRVKDPIASWNIFNRSDLKGRMTLLNDMREVLGAALRVYGFSVNTLDKNEIDLAAALVMEWKKNIAKFESEQYKNGIASGEYLISQGYSSDIAQVMDENEEVGILLPVEGAVFSCDYVAIPKGVSSLELAYTFINFMLEPNVAAENMEANFYLSPNKLAFRLLSDDLRQNPVIFPPKAFLESSEVIQDVGENITLYIDAWERIKN